MQADLKYQRRWKTLAVLSLSLVIIGLDNTILNVALPTLQEEFNASGSELQWMVDSYLLVFAGLLLATRRPGRSHRPQEEPVRRAGDLRARERRRRAQRDHDRDDRRPRGDGRRRRADHAVDPLHRDRRLPRGGARQGNRRVGGTAAIGIGLGPLIGGALVEFASWQWVFIVNVPVVIAALAFGHVLVPDSKDPKPGAIDVPGALLAVGSLSTLVYGLIEAPERGWLAATMVASFVSAIVLGVGFVVRELRTDSPLLDVTLFRRRGFSFGSLGISSTFFAMFGMIFVLTQYLQNVQGAGPFEAGLSRRRWRRP